MLARRSNAIAGRLIGTAAAGIAIAACIGASSITSGVEAGAQWNGVRPDGAQWNGVVVLAGAQWNAVAPAGAQWNGVAPTGAQWNAVAPAGAQWN